MKMFYTFYVWLMSMIQTFKGDLPAPMEETKVKPLRLDLQFFADDSDDDDSDTDDDADDDDNDDADDDTPNFDELMKDKKFKKQLSEHTKGILGKRLKKYENVDVEEYKRLKAAADKKSTKTKDSDDADDDQPNAEQQKRLLRAERREKQAVVKEFAVENGHNPKLLARLIDIDAIELDDDGEPENLDDLFEELETDFPEYFGASDDDDDEEERPAKKKKSGYVPGSTQKGNKKKKVDAKEAGRQRALARHKKKEEN